MGICMAWGENVLRPFSVKRLGQVNVYPHDAASALQYRPTFKEMARRPLRKKLKRKQENLVVTSITVEMDIDCTYAYTYISKFF